MTTYFDTMAEELSCLRLAPLDVADDATVYWETQLVDDASACAAHPTFPHHLRDAIDRAVFTYGLSTAPPGADNQVVAAVVRAGGDEASQRQAGFHSLRCLLDALHAIFHEAARAPSYPFNDNPRAPWDGEADAARARRAARWPASPKGTTPP